MGVLAAALGLSGAPPAQATAPPDGWTYYIGNNGALWSYSRFPDGTFSQAAQRGPTGVARPGAPVTAVLDTAPAVFFVGLDGAVYENCPAAPQPIPVTNSGYAPSGAAISAAEGYGWVSVVVSTVPHQGPQAAPARRQGAPGSYPVEISNPCVHPVVSQNMTVSSASVYTGGDMASAADSLGTHAVFYVSSVGAVTAGWYGASSGTPYMVPLTGSGAAVPGSGVAATYDLDGSLVLFYAGVDGRLYRVFPQWGSGPAGTPVPNPTGPADVPKGAHLVASTSFAGTAVGYAAADGTLTVATLSASSDWLATSKLGPTGFLAPGSSVAADAAADDGFDWYCGNEPHFPVHIHGPQPGPGWSTAGPANAITTAYFAAA